MGFSTAAQNLFLIFGLLLTTKYSQCHKSSQSMHLRRERSAAIEPTEKHSNKSLVRHNSGSFEEGKYNSTNSEDSDLEDLNKCLETLAEIFPDVQIEVFREMLLTFDPESRLAVITESLLKHKTKWVRDRYKSAKNSVKSTVQDKKQYTDHYGWVLTQEKFRSSSYRKAARKLVCQEFKSLSRSTVNMVLAEHNYSYILARPDLIALSAKSWRFSISVLFKRKKCVSSIDLGYHPLIIWDSKSQEPAFPVLKSSGCIELDQEISDSLINPFIQKALVEQEEKDYNLAVEINNSEAVHHRSLYDCECCFTAVCFERLVACDSGHLICFDCIGNSLKEAVFCQGWQRLINLDQGSLHCVAAVSDECSGTIPFDFIRRALEKDQAGQNALRKLDQRLAEENMLKSRLPLVRCPFCNYAEVDELYVPESKRHCKLKCLHSFTWSSFLILLFCACMIPILISFMLLPSVFLLFKGQTPQKYIGDQFTSSVNRIRRKYLGLKFCCKNKFCAQASCRFCLKQWSDIHICHESSLQDLRTHVELAMSVAIKRTCPRCNTSFVKTSGCNKLTCVCGHQMCYICRKEIGNGEGYRHFCEHFRPNGGKTCSECVKCDLYRCEDDEVVLKKAKREAERQWMKREKKLIGCDEKFLKMLETKCKLVGDAPLLDSRQWSWKMPNMELLVDTIVETLVIVE